MDARRRCGYLVAALLTVSLPSCGAGTGGAPSAAPAAPLTARDPAVTEVPRATPLDFRAPIAAYRRHAARELSAMLVDVGVLRRAVARRDLAAARSAWLRADERYETIGAAYGAFGSLDVAINGRAAGLPGGARSRRFRGLHRVELGLWGRRSTADARAPVAELERAVRRLRSRIPSLHIEPLDYALRSHEVLEGALHLQLSGDASPWSGAALTALRGNLEGTRVMLGTLRPLVVRRDPQRLVQVRRVLARLTRGLAEVGGDTPTPPRWRALDQRDRERIAGLTAAAVEQLAFIPELVDPRPPRPVQRAFGGDR